MLSHRAISRGPGRTMRTLMIAAALALPVAMISATPARAEVVISVGFAPPLLPVYAQPLCPGEGYLWTPGYWAYGPDGYFWVPGTWVRPPVIGYLWTPAYWGWGGSAFIFHRGYWGPHIGFYGGINYGFGYGGVGYEGGYWRGNGFYYNRSVNNIRGASVRNVYEHPVAVHNAAFNHISFNGGNGGIPYRASSEELQAISERHIQPTGEQMQHQNFAAQNRAQFASVNRGRPGVTAAPTPSAFHANPGNPSAAARGGFGASRPTTATRPGGASSPSMAPPREQQSRTAAPRPESRPSPRFESRPGPAPHSSGGGGHQGGKPHR
jgi:hypothetical protein